MIINALSLSKNAFTGRRMGIGLPMVKSDSDLQWKDFPQTVLMPCGKKFKFDSLEQVPKENTKCPCGHPDHWIVKYF